MSTRVGLWGGEEIRVFHRAESQKRRPSALGTKHPSTIRYCVVSVIWDGVYGRGIGRNFRPGWRNLRRCEVRIRLNSIKFPVWLKALVYFFFSSTLHTLSAHFVLL